MAELSYLVAKHMRLPDKQCKEIYIGGLLHDFGKIGISDSILRKHTKLTDDEFSKVKLHPQLGYDILKQIPCFKRSSVLDIVLYHHERFDGKGYPYGLKGEKIPLAASIIAIADAFDAMISKRVYRKNQDFHSVLNEIKRNIGRQFDFTVVKAFLDFCQNDQSAECFKEDKSLSQF